MAPVPAVGPIMGFGAQAVVGDARAEIVVGGVVGAVGLHINVESRGEVLDVDPAAISLLGLGWMDQIGFGEGLEGKGRRD